MRPRLNFIILGVKDIRAAAAFYHALGWESTEDNGNDVGPTGDVTFFALENGMMLGLVPRDELADEAQIELGERSPSELSLEYNVNSKEQVGSVIKLAETAGAKVTSRPAERAWGGYSGYFVDPGGHLWAIVYNPRLRVKE